MIAEHEDLEDDDELNPVDVLADEPPQHLRHAAENVGQRYERRGENLLAAERQQLFRERARRICSFDDLFGIVAPRVLCRQVTDE